MTYNPKNLRGLLLALLDLEGRNEPLPLRREREFSDGDTLSPFLFLHMKRDGYIKTLWIAGFSFRIQSILGA